MKRMKIVACLLLTIVMMMGLATTAFAANITVDDTGSTSTYVAYRLLDATNSADDTTKFAYTLNDKYADVLRAVTDKETEAEIVAYINALDSEGIRTFADNVYNLIRTRDTDVVAVDGKFTDIDQGYYLIVETSVNDDGEDAYSLVMLDTAGQEDVTVITKEDVPSVEKKVKDTDDSTGVTTDWQDSADYDIGDSIPYQITGTVSSQYDNYKTYYYSFVDTMSEGLTYNNDAKIYLVNDDTRVEISTAYYDLTWENQVLTITFEDLKNVAGVAAESKILVEYTATLNEQAVTGAAGNPNKVILVYNRNPYAECVGKPEEPGETPEDTNVVFTFEGIVNKVDADGNALKGAGFTLYKFDEQKQDYVAVGDEITDVTKFEFKGLDAGQYKLVETTVPAGYNKADDIEFTIEATHDTTADDPQLTELVVKDKDGNVISEGATITFRADKTEGTVTTDVTNFSGTELPSTGGIGTKIFYVAGSVLVLFAGVILISRRRMANR